MPFEYPFNWIMVCHKKLAKNHNSSNILRECTYKIYRICLSANGVLPGTVHQQLRLALNAVPACSYKDPDKETKYFLTHQFKGDSNPNDKYVLSEKTL